MVAALISCRLDSVTDTLSELGLPSFRTLFNDCVHNFNQRWLTSVKMLLDISLDRDVQFLVFRSVVFSIFGI